MHKFLRAVGFSNIRKKDLEIILLVEHPEIMKVTRDSEGNEFAEISKSYGDNIGLMVRGCYDEEDVFHMEYYYPYVPAMDLSTQEQVDVEKHAEKESYAGVCDEMRLGVTLIFYLQNVADFLSEYRTNIHVKHLRGAMLSALSVEGKILLPIEQKVKEKQAANFRQEKRRQLIAQAREGNEDAIENLTMEDMDTYSLLSRRIMREDVLSIVNSTFMPYGIRLFLLYLYEKPLPSKAAEGIARYIGFSDETDTETMLGFESEIIEESRKNRVSIFWNYFQRWKMQYLKQISQ